MRAARLAAKASPDAASARPGKQAKRCLREAPAPSDALPGARACAAATRRRHCARTVQCGFVLVVCCLLQFTTVRVSPSDDHAFLGREI